MANQNAIDKFLDVRIVIYKNVCYINVLEYRILYIFDLQHDNRNIQNLHWKQK